MPTINLRLLEEMVGTLRFAHPTIVALMPQFRLDHGLSNFGAAVGAFIGEVDLRHAPMRFDVPHIHRNPDAARTDDEGRFGIVVMMDIGWHVGSPQQKHSPVALTRHEHTPRRANAIMNSREHRKNSRTIPACVTDLHDRGRRATARQFSSRDSGLPSARFR